MEETREKSKQKLKKRKSNKEDTQISKKRLKSTKSVKFSNDTKEHQENDLPSFKKSKKRNTNSIPDNSEELNEDINQKISNSKRSKKRIKFEQLKAEQKLNNEAAMQTKALNYLSLWKHNRKEWKFEKLKQIWIRNRLFDSVLIPDEFWDTVLEYFTNSKGQIRQALMDECKKIIDERNEAKGKDLDYDEIKYDRAESLLKCIN